jgi:hypothetical protein
MRVGQASGPGLGKLSFVILKSFVRYTLNHMDVLDCGAMAGGLESSLTFRGRVPLEWTDV